MIGLVVGQMDFQQVQISVKGVDEADPSGDEMHGTDAAMGHAAGAVGHLVLDVPRGEHGSLTTTVVALIEPSFDPPLAIGESAPYDRVHSKSLLVLRVKTVDQSSDAATNARVSSFFQNANLPSSLG